MRAHASDHQIRAAVRDRAAATDPGWVSSRPPWPSLNAGQRARLAPPGSRLRVTHVLSDGVWFSPTDMRLREGGERTVLDGVSEGTHAYEGREYLGLQLLPDGPLIGGDPPRAMPLPVSEIAAVDALDEHGQLLLDGPPGWQPSAPGPHADPRVAGRRVP